jgi:hypothetical protein
MQDLQGQIHAYVCKIQGQIHHQQPLSQPWDSCAVAEMVIALPGFFCLACKVAFESFLPEW